MRILFYGGCHASILSSLLTKHSQSAEVKADVLTNFELIRSGDPFPFEKLREYDAVVYSPIENKGTYNTSLLPQRCREAGVASICFPWLEWHGYAPGARKVALSAHLDWGYPELFAEAERFTSFDRFAESVPRNFPPRDIVGSILTLSSQHVEDAERRAEADVSVVDLIRHKYRTERVFLTSDHPSKLVYTHVLQGIAARAGIELTEEGRELREEPQPESVMPIFPIVAEELELEFSTDLWRDDQAMSRMRDYLYLHFTAGGHGRPEAGSSGTSGAEAVAGL